MPKISTKMQNELRDKRRKEYLSLSEISRQTCISRITITKVFREDNPNVNDTTIMVLEDWLKGCLNRIKD